MQPVSRRTFLGAILAASTSEATLRAQETLPREQLEAAARRNEVIHRARQVGLDILQPTTKEFEHGLELHANSLVFDTNGFAPRAALRVG